MKINMINSIFLKNMKTSRAIFVVAVLFLMIVTSNFLFFIVNARAAETTVYYSGYDSGYPKLLCPVGYPIFVSGFGTEKNTGTILPIATSFSPGIPASQGGAFYYVDCSSVAQQANGCTLQITCSPAVCTVTSWSPDVSSVCSGSSFTQSNGCTTQAATGTATGGAYSPDPSTVCSGTSFIQSNSCGVQTVAGTKDCSCTPTSWTPDSASTCSTSTLTQTSDCGTTRTVSGTKDCSCTPTAWTPLASSVCSGLSFTQSNGCTTQPATGAGTGGPWTPPASDTCIGTLVAQTNTCGAQSMPGTKVCCTPTTWSPATSSVCAGTNVTQTSNCGSTRTATGTKYCPGADWKEVPVN
jgi:hypothetical protein